MAFRGRSIVNAQVEFLTVVQSVLQKRQMALPKKEQGGACAKTR
jgi:hypothetical protein